MLQRNKPILHDPMIIPRVKQYLEENVHQTYVDVGVMARELQDRYREYTRRKAVPFRMLVEQAYKTVLHSYGLDSNPSTDNDDDVNSDLELMDEDTSNNHMSDTLTNMYINNKNKGAGGGNDDELIDISSDDDDDSNKGSKQSKKNEAISTTTSDKTQKTTAEPMSAHLNANQQITITKVLPPNKDKERQNEVTNSTINNGNSHELGKKVVSSSNLNKNASIVPHLAKKRKLDNLSVEINGQIQQATSVPPAVIIPTLASPMATISSSKSSTKNNKSDLSANANPSQKLKKYRKEVFANFVDTTFEDVGGMDKILKELCELLLHVKHPEVYRHIGLPPPRGFLLHGPPGSGKTLLAHAIAGQLCVGLIEIPATELVAGVSGESEERIREVFEQAAALAPCVLFIDEIDAISSNRLNAQKDMERRIVAQLLSSLDGLSKHEKGDQVLVIGATNRVEALDPSLRRVGRFDQEISLGIPDRDARAQILRIICRKLKIEHPFDFDYLAQLTPGYVGADLLALATRAATTAIKRMFTSKENIQLEKQFESTHQQEIQFEDLTEDTAIMDCDDKGDDDAVVELIDDTEKEAPHAKTNERNDDVVVAVDLDGDEVVDLDDEKDETPTPKAVTEENKEKVVEDGIEVAEKKDETEKKDEAEKKNDVEIEAMEVASEAEAEAEKVVEKAADKVESMEEDIEMVADSSSNMDEAEPKAVEKAAEEAVKEDKPAEITQSVEAESATAVVEVSKDDEIEKQIDDQLLEAGKKLDDLTETPETNESDEKVSSSEADLTKEVEVQKPEEKDDEIVMIAEDEKKEVPAETVINSMADAVLSKPELKLTLSLSNMMNWLDSNKAPLSDNELLELRITTKDFLEALKYVQPSAKREGFITVPDVTWDDIGSLNDIREELKLAILAPVKFPQKLKLLGLTAPSGVLLCGPPGCGKTLLAKAVANEAGINFISVKGPELLNMYVGESERAVRQCFQRARNSTPCVIFFDEFDSLCPKRSDSAEGGAGMRVVNQLLTEMDGIEERKGVFLMAATNRPDIVDPAVLRPGRLDKILYVGLPEANDREDILRALTKNGTKPPLDTDVQLQEIARYTEGYTGADLAGLVRTASLHTLKESLLTDVADNSNALTVKNEHFLAAFRSIKPSVNEDDKKHYEKLKKKYGTTNVDLQ